jgi:hypothetical protein
MGWLHTKPVEEVIRKLFRKKDTVTFWEMVVEGFPLAEPLSDSNTIETQNEDRKKRQYLYELALDTALRNYLAMGCVYPAEWRDVLDDFVSEARELRAFELQERGLPEETMLAFYSNAQVRALFESIDGWSVTPHCYKSEFASAICRALAGWKKPTPPWLNRSAAFQKKTSIEACQRVLVYWALPAEDADEIARPVKWKAGRSLFDAPYVDGVDL